MTEKLSDVLKLTIEDLNAVLEHVLNEENTPQEPAYVHPCCGNCGRYRGCCNSMRDRTVVGNWCGKWTPESEPQLEAREQEMLEYLAEIKEMKA